jgi:hypothetical protein
MRDNTSLRRVPGSAPFPWFTRPTHLTRTVDCRLEYDSIREPGRCLAEELSRGLPQAQ